MKLDGGEDLFVFPAVLCEPPVPVRPGYVFDLGAFVFPERDDDLAGLYRVAA
jgi:hypothetical protein